MVPRPGLCLPRRLQGVKDWGYGTQRLGVFNGTIDPNDPTTTGHAVFVVGFSNSGRPAGPWMRLPGCRWTNGLLARQC
jgi:hypothetical protein